jgi:hypothetical protein
MRTDTKLYSKILAFACNSFYRNNAKTAGFYGFAIIGGSWQGGWTWNEKSEYPHIIELATGKLLK